MKQQRIALLAPIKRAITPAVTASRPRVVFDLATGLVARGHTVTVFGTGDSTIPGAQIVPIVPRALTAMPPAENPFYQHTEYLVQMITKAAEKSGEFDIVHNHMYPEYLALLASSSFQVPLVTTVHSQMTPDMVATLQAFKHAHLLAISESAKRASGLPLPVVYNGIDTYRFVTANVEKTYLLFVGRMSSAKDEQGNFMDPKGVTHAIALAKHVNMPLHIVGNVEDPAFYETLIKPHLSDTISFVGPVTSEQALTREQVIEQYQGAIALINPINWEEPFGLVMAEAMACGVPVVAFNRGSVSELIVDGKTGFVIKPDQIDSRNPRMDKPKILGIDTQGLESSDGQAQDSGNLHIKKIGIDGLMEAVKRIGEIDPAVCRSHAVDHFSTDAMVSQYEKVYEGLVGGSV